jgi:2-polyprenyl-6-methoxyphenol hydroxylase-like FAD-dependent oxidoreductase
VHELATSLVVAADGRGSVVRDSAGLRPRSFGAPMDVQWFRLPRHPDDPVGGVARVTEGRIFVLIDRGDYWQCGHVIPKGTDERMRAAGIESFRADLARLVPWLGDRVSALRSWDDVRLLDVRLDRLPRWHGDGVLAIGDAAHAMSPVGGVGINLAVQDGVAAARILADPLLRAQQGGAAPRPSELARVERRRWLPTTLVQGFQRFAHRNLLRPTLRARSGQPARPRPTRLPLPLRVLTRFPRLQALPTSFIAIGPLPEHAPAWARRPQQPATTSPP